MAADTRFRAMGTDAHIVVVGGDPSLASRARQRVDELERLWSRFVPESEISELNRRAGSGVQVSPETTLLIQRAIEAWRMCGGLFDPTVLGAVLRAGYDRSFETIAASDVPVVSLLGIGADDIVVHGDTVRLPEGVGFDPGGIGKGLAADLVATETIAAGADGVCVNLGGDVRVSGAAPDGEAWAIAVEHPWRAEPIATFGVAEGAVATSTTLRRRWVRSGELRHHLIDPMTGLPSTTDVNLATVVCAEAWAAEVLAKSVLLRGSEHAFDILAGTGAQALAVDTAGRVQTTDALHQFGEVNSGLLVQPAGARSA